MSDYPWITYSARKKLDKIIQPNFVCFEWGSGGSTIYLSRRVKKVVSVEHDENWFQKVSQKLQSGRLTNCDYRLIAPESFNLGALFCPVAGQYCSTDKDLAGKIFYKYCREILKFRDGYFDLILVDGRARVSCLYFAWSKVKAGGFTVLDNSDREEYLSGINFLNDWRREDFFGHGPYNKEKWQTSFFQKP